MVYGVVYFKFDYIVPDVKLTSYNRRATITLIFLSLFLSWLFSQTQNEPFSDEKGGKEYYLQPTLEKPRIDGSLNDPCWVQIIPITDFIQEEPENMGEPTEKTEVYLTYDSQALYIAARLYDSMPSDITRQLAPRDDWYGAFDEMADWFSIDLDSRHDHQTGFSFAVNASGVISDEMIYRDEDFDSDWNAIWLAEVQIDELGWSVEMEIPFSNLPFFAGDKLIWGLNITRFIKRKYETVTWVAFPLDVEGVASKYGHLHGLKGIYPPAKFEFIPYSMTGVTNYNDIRLKQIWEPGIHRLNYYKEPNNNLGVDILYRINPSSQLMLSINPDFGQVESDPAIINLTAFETYFTEKRPFFLNNMDIFETPIQIFYSRRIGDNSTGIGMHKERNDTLFTEITITTKINVAGKLTGKNENGLSYGLLSALVTESDSSKWKNYYNPDTIYYPYKYPKKYFVGRLKQDLFSGNSFLGLMSTSSFVDSTHTFSVDGMANFLDNQLSIDGQMVITADEHKGFYSNMSFYPSGYISGWVDYYYYDKKLNVNDLGYLWRNNYTQSKIGLKFQTLENWRMIRNAFIILEGDVEENTDGLNLGKTIELNYDIQFDSFWETGGGIYKIMDYYDDRKIILDYELNEFGPPIFIPEIIGSHFHITMDKHQSLWASISLTSAKNIRNESELAQYAQLTYKPNPHLNFSISYDHYLLNKKYHWLESFWEVYTYKKNQYHHIFSSLKRTIDIFTFRSTFNINRELSLKGYLEIYSNYDIYNNYTEYLPSISEYDDKSSYILGLPPDWAGKPLYTSDTSSVSLEYSFVDPNVDLQFHPKYTDFRSIIVVKWNYRNGSNLYFIYSNNKAVDGHRFNKINQLSDFISFNHYEPWVEVLRDQTFMIKIDFWFEK